MKIFYCGIQYDYYDQRRGLSFEHENFYSSFANMSGVQMRYFPFDDILKKGKRQWNMDLLAAAKDERPDLIFFFMLSDELDPRVLLELKGITKTLAWFADDHWRFHNYSKYWARRFTHVVTTYSRAVEWYGRAGISNALHSQWAANPRGEDTLKNLSTGADVAFVGSWSRPRERVVKYLKDSGIAAETRGGGWPGGRVTKEEMIKIFASAKINLALNPAPGFFNLNSLGRLVIRRSINRLVFDPHIIRNIRCLFARGIRQIKARHFEIPGCGGFMMTASADDLQNYYVPGKEIVVYDSMRDLAGKIRYYLAHDDERRAIARAGYERTIRDHTYEKRFTEIFARIGLS